MAIQQQTVGSTSFPARATTSRTEWMKSLEAPEPLRTAGTVVALGEGSEIFAEGDSSELFFKVISGVVRICKFLSDGRRQIEAFHGAGEVFGFELGSHRMLSAEAVSECTLVSYRRRGVEILAQKDETVTRQLFHYAMQGLAQAQGHSLLLGRRGAAEKVASFLLSLSEKSSDSHLVRLAMTRQDIADYLGLTIETVSRTLSQFERDHVIALPTARQVRLERIETLRNIAA
jgi:CRP/FNR family nitrogen fixation transcriptional regulator